MNATSKQRGALDAELDRIERGARQVAIWPAPAGSRWVAEAAGMLLFLIGVVRELQADLMDARGEPARREGSAAGGDV